MQRLLLLAALGCLLAAPPPSPKILHRFRPDDEPRKP